MTSDEFIEAFVINHENYNNDSLNYDLIPSINLGEGYNSNSYVSGLIETTLGSQLGDKSMNIRFAPGWGTPVPARYF